MISAKEMFEVAKACAGGDNFELLKELTAHWTLKDLEQFRKTLIQYKEMNNG